MAPVTPFIEALKVDRVTADAGQAFYKGKIDAGWLVNKVPNGGYVLALIIQSCIDLQTGSRHPDPIHVTTHYLRTTQPGDFEVQIKTVKTGKGFTNFAAELSQNGELKITSQLIFGSLSPDPDKSKPRVAIEPSSPWARRHPLYQHPSEAQIAQKPIRSRYKFLDNVKFADDPEFDRRNLATHPLRSKEGSIGGGGVEAGIWFQFRDPVEKLTLPALAFLGDITTLGHALSHVDGAVQVSEGQRLTRKRWFPTMIMTLEFKAPIPRPLPGVYADRTVGLYATAVFLGDPQGRHDHTCEIWTAPTNIGEGEVQAGWREKQTCLAVMRQMALTIPMTVQENANKSKSKL